MGQAHARPCETTAEFSGDETSTTSATDDVPVEVAEGSTPLLQLDRTRRTTLQLLCRGGVLHLIESLEDNRRSSLADDELAGFKLPKHLHSNRRETAVLSLGLGPGVHVMESSLVFKSEARKRAVWLRRDGSFIKLDGSAPFASSTVSVSVGAHATTASLVQDGPGLLAYRHRARPGQLWLQQALCWLLVRAAAAPAVDLRDPSTVHRLAHALLPTLGRVGKAKHAAALSAQLVVVVGHLSTVVRPRGALLRLLRSPPEHTDSENGDDDEATTALSSYSGVDKDERDGGLAGRMQRALVTLLHDLRRTCQADRPMDVSAPSCSSCCCCFPVSSRRQALVSCLLGITTTTPSPSPSAAPSSSSVVLPSASSSSGTTAMFRGNKKRATRSRGTSGAQLIEEEKTAVHLEEKEESPRRARMFASWSGSKGRRSLGARLCSVLCGCFRSRPGQQDPPEAVTGLLVEPEQVGTLLAVSSSTRRRASRRASWRGPCVVSLCCHVQGGVLVVGWLRSTLGPFSCGVAPTPVPGLRIQVARPSTRCFNFDLPPCPSEQLFYFKQHGPARLLDAAPEDEDEQSHLLLRAPSRVRFYEAGGAKVMVWCGWRTGQQYRILLVAVIVMASPSPIASTGALPQLTQASPAFLPFYRPLGPLGAAPSSWSSLSLRSLLAPACTGTLLLLPAPCRHADTPRPALRAEADDSSSSSSTTTTTARPTSAAPAAPAPAVLLLSAPCHADTPRPALRAEADDSSSSSTTPPPAVAAAPAAPAPAGGAVVVPSAVVVSSLPPVLEPSQRSAMAFHQPARQLPPSLPTPLRTSPVADLKPGCESRQSSYHRYYPIKPATSALDLAPACPSPPMRLDMEDSGGQASTPVIEATFQPSAVQRSSPPVTITAVPVPTVEPQHPPCPTPGGLDLLPTAEEESAAVAPDMRAPPELSAVGLTEEPTPSPLHQDTLATTPTEFQEAEEEESAAVAPTGLPRPLTAVEAFREELTHEVTLGNRNLKTTDLEAVWKLLVERATDLRRCARLYATLHLLLCRKSNLRYRKNGRRQHGACNPMPEEGEVKLLVERLGARDLHVELLLGLHEYAFSDKRFRRHEAQYAPKVVMVEVGALLLKFGLPEDSLERFVAVLVEGGKWQHELHELGGTLVLDTLAARDRLLAQPPPPPQQAEEQQQPAVEQPLEEAKAPETELLDATPQLLREKEAPAEASKLEGEALQLLIEEPGVIEEEEEPEPRPVISQSPPPVISQCFQQEQGWQPPTWEQQQRFTPGPSCMGQQQQQQRQQGWSRPRQPPAAPRHPEPSWDRPHPLLRCQSSDTNNNNNYLHRDHRQQHRPQHPQQHRHQHGGFDRHPQGHQHGGGSSSSRARTATPQQLARQGAYTANHHHHNNQGRDYSAHEPASSMGYRRSNSHRGHQQQQCPPQQEEEQRRPRTVNRDALMQVLRHHKL